MDVLCPELLVQALTQSPQGMLAGREDARRGVPADAGRRPSEDERTALALRVDLVLPELFDDLVRKPERAVDVRVDDDLDVLLGDIEEQLACGGPGVVQRDTDLRPPTRRPGVRADGVEDVGKCLEAVRLDGECRNLSPVSKRISSQADHHAPRRRKQQQQRHQLLS